LRYSLQQKKELSMLNIYKSIDDCPVFLPPNSIVNTDFILALKIIADGSVDAVIIDPPYTDGKTDALPNHKIQTKIDIDLIMREAYRILKPDGFFVFFGQMPTVLSWLNSATNVFRYKEHITWCKRNITSPYLDIQRNKEEIFIYCKGKPKYHETQAKYEDLKTPALHLGIYELSTIKTTISDLQRRCIDNAYNMKYFSGVPTSLGDHNDKTLRYTSADRPKQDGEILDDTANNDIWRAKKLDKAERKTQDFDRAKADFELLAKSSCKGGQVGYQDPKTNDAIYNKYNKERKSKADFEDAVKHQKVQIAHGRANDEWLEKKMLNAAIEREKADFENAVRTNSKQENKKEDRGTRERNEDIYNERYASSFRYRSKHWCNILNTWAFMLDDYEAEHLETLWSYLTQNQTKMGADGENWKHPTVKPVLLLERLIALLCPKPTDEIKPLVVDFFLGSGTLGVAAANLGVDFIGIELQQDYFEMSVFRTEKAMQRQGKPIEIYKPEPKQNEPELPTLPRYKQSELF
jgi:DNA modification methylase